MRIDGAYTFDAPRDQVWSLLHDAAAIRMALPGCEHFQHHAAGEYHVVISMPGGPFQGYYNGVVLQEDGQPGRQFSLSFTGHGRDMALTGSGTLALEEVGGQTRLSYEGYLEVSGQLASQSPRLLRTTANYLIRSFFEALDRQMRDTAGSASMNGALPSEETLTVRGGSTMIDMQDFIAELRRDRWVATSVLAMLFLLLSSVLGVVFLVSLVSRQVMRLFTNRAPRPVEERPAGELPGGAP